MDNARETVKKAVRFQSPERIPLLFATSLEKSDIVNIPVVRHFIGEGGRFSEWGFEWENLNGDLAMGQPKNQVITDYDMLENYRPPKADDTDRFQKTIEMMAQYGADKYYKANFNLSGFAIMTMLRGFSQVMEDFYLAREALETLCDMVFDFECEVIKRLPSYGFDAVGFADDWGTQNSLFIPPELWRQVFKPRYAKQYDLAHSLGLDVYLHSCGYIFDIIPDLIEIGLDILNPGQPDINGVERMGKEFGGKICFSCPVSYQTTAITGSKDDIRAQIASYINCLGCFNGGLIGIIPEDSASLGISDESFKYMEMLYRTTGSISRESTITNY